VLYPGAVDQIREAEAGNTTGADELWLLAQQAERERRS
jgi:hypothetical protein